MRAQVAQMLSQQPPQAEDERVSSKRPRMAAAPIDVCNYSIVNLASTAGEPII